ncbi:MAG: DUF4234 domain-containing protein [Bacillota bacterium]|nr:DUF4234 domain-containing protein [Bacillota bacterium]
MNKIISRPRGDGYFFLTACILFSVNFLYSLWGFFNYMYFPTFLNVALSLAVCVLFFLAYMGKIKVFIPFIVLAAEILIFCIERYAAHSGFFGLLNFAAAVFAVLCVMGIVDFSFNNGLPEKLKSTANDPCIVAGAAFVVLGVIAAVRAALLFRFGLSPLYAFNTICMFAGAALAVYSLEVERVETAEGNGGYSYQEAADMAREGNGGAESNGNQYGSGGTFETAFGKVPGILVQEENIVKNVVFSVITFGIYLYIWWYRVCKRMRFIEDRDSACGGELACIILVPFYSLYWFYTRGQRFSENAKRFGINVKDSSVLYLVLAIFGLGIVSFILLQSELNTFADKLRRGIKDYNPETQYGYARYEGNPGQTDRNQDSPKQENPAEESEAQEKPCRDDSEQANKDEDTSGAKAEVRENADDIIETIKKLSELKDQGILSEEEFAAKKAELLNRF